MRSDDTTIETTVIPNAPDAPAPPVAPPPPPPPPPSVMNVLSTTKPKNVVEVPELIAIDQQYPNNCQEKLDALSTLHVDLLEKKKNADSDLNKKSTDLQTVQQKILDLGEVITASKAEILYLENVMSAAAEDKKFIAERRKNIEEKKEKIFNKKNELDKTSLLIPSLEIEKKNAAKKSSGLVEPLALVVAKKIEVNNALKSNSLAGSSEPTPSSENKKATKKTGATKRFSQLRSKDVSDFQYTDRQILQLAMALIPPDDWKDAPVGFHEDRMKAILHSAFSKELPNTALGKDPLKKLGEILQIDAITEYQQQQEKMKKEEEEQRKKDEEERKKKQAEKRKEEDKKKKEEEEKQKALAENLKKEQQEGSRKKTQKPPAIVITPVGSPDKTDIGVEPARNLLKPGGLSPNSAATLQKRLLDLEEKLALTQANTSLNPQSQLLTPSKEKTLQEAPLVRKKLFDTEEENAQLKIKIAQLKESSPPSYQGPEIFDPDRVQKQKGLSPRSKSARSSAYQ